MELQRGSAALHLGPRVDSVNSLSLAFGVPATVQIYCTLARLRLTAAWRLHIIDSCENTGRHTVLGRGIAPAQAAGKHTNESRGVTTG